MNPVGDIIGNQNPLMVYLIQRQVLDVKLRRKRFPSSVFHEGSLAVGPCVILRLLEKPFHSLLVLQVRLTKRIHGHGFHGLSITSQLFDSAWVGMIVDLVSMIENDHHVIQSIECCQSSVANRFRFSASSDIRSNARCGNQGLFAVMNWERFVFHPGPVSFLRLNAVGDGRRHAAANVY